MVKGYIPSKGDICWASLDPTLGHEQKGGRPVIVLSPINYNQQSELALVCPLTSRIKGYSFEVKLGDKGVILADHLKSVSWKERDFHYITKAPIDVLENILSKIKTLLDV